MGKEGVSLYVNSQDIEQFIDRNKPTTNDRPPSSFPPPGAVLLWALQVLSVQHLD
jgi:hypothetical protein